MNKSDKDSRDKTSERMQLVEKLRVEGIKDERVLKAIATVPRHQFIDEAITHLAYEDTALSIGYLQTISQPFIVARMTESILTTGDCKRVLEVGTGSGYQAAVLSKVVSELISLERIGELAKRSKYLLQRLNIRNVQVLHRNGCNGYAKLAPYDAIVVTAASVTIPPALLEQLADGGRMIMPVGEEGNQELVLITKAGNNFTQQILEKVRFVPLIDENGE